MFWWLVAFVSELVIYAILGVLWKQKSSRRRDSDIDDNSFRVVLPDRSDEQEKRDTG